MKMKKWMWRLIGFGILAIPFIIAFQSTTWALILVLLEVIGLAGLVFLLDFATFNTQVPWGIPAVIHANDMKHLRNDDREYMEWIEREGEHLYVEEKKGFVQQAVYLEHPNPKGLVYLCHGYGDYGCQSVALPARRFYEAGYSIFLPRSRGFGSKDGHWTTMGVLERGDHIEWLERISKRFPYADIYLYGVSMGAASVMNLCDYENSQIRGIIEDCGYLSLADQLSHSMTVVIGADQFPLYPLTRLLVGFYPGFDMHGMDVREKLGRSLYPLIAFHGRQDDFVPFENLELVKRYAGKHLEEAIAVDQCVHCQSYLKDQAYFSKIEQFMARHASSAKAKSDEYHSDEYNEEDKNSLIEWSE